MELSTIICSPEYETEQPYDTLTFDKANVADSGSVITRTSKRSKKRIYVLVIVVVSIVVATAAVAFALGVGLSVKQQSSHQALQTGKKICSPITLDENLIFFDDLETQAGDIVAVTCANNTKLVGTSQVICLSSGKWSNQPKCEKMKCPTLVLPENAVAGKTNNTDVGTKIRVFCRDGFLAKGNQTVECMPDENWTPFPHCEAVDCGKPANIHKGTIINTTATDFNTSLQVVCDEGYRLTDNSSKLFCNKYGQWEGSPICSIITCGLPAIPENGSISVIDGLEYQDKVLYQCNEGFFLKGNDTALCIRNGTWSTPPQCIQDIDECASIPCLYGSTCLDGLNMYSCACTPGYTGINFETNINECASLPCFYGGSCLDGLNVYTCACQPGYTGTNCETDIDECASIPCLYGSTCLDGLNMYSCACTPGYTGINCETNINECASLPCLYGGSCLDGLNVYTCTCKPGYTGTNCETADKICSLLTNGTCQNNWRNYGCSCYLLLPNSKTFLEAEKYSEVVGGHLVHVNSYGENVFLKGYLEDMNAGNTWMGLTDMESDRTWYYYGTNTSPTYTDWAPGEPTDKGPHCVQFWKEFKYAWDDDFCSFTRRVLCEIEN